MQFPELERITLDPMIMGGKPCIRGMRVTVGTIVGLVASGASFEEILRLYPHLESEDIRAASCWPERSSSIRSHRRSHATPIATIGWAPCRILWRFYYNIGSQRRDPLCCIEVLGQHCAL